MKKVLLFLVLLLPWFFSSLFPLDYSFYETLQLPFFAPPSFLFGIVWAIVYLGIAISSYQVISKYGIKDTPKSYKIKLFINYLWNQSFPFLFFGLQSTFGGLVATVGTFISSLFLYEETSKLNEKSTNFLNLYILWGLFATVLAFTTYVLNIA